jgi:hypothetical protein
VGTAGVVAVVKVTGPSFAGRYWPCVVSCVFCTTARNGATVRLVLELRVSSPIVPGGPYSTPGTPCTPPVALRNAPPAASRSTFPERTSPAEPSAYGGDSRVTGQLQEGAVRAVTPADWSVPPVADRSRSSVPPGGMRGNVESGPHAS